MSCARSNPSSPTLRSLGARYFHAQTRQTEKIAHPGPLPPSSARPRVASHPRQRRLAGTESTGTDLPVPAHPPRHHPPPPPPHAAARTRPRRVHYGARGGLRSRYERSRYRGTAGRRLGARNREPSKSQKPICPSVIALHRKSHHHAPSAIFPHKPRPAPAQRIAVTVASAPRQTTAPTGPTDTRHEPPSLPPSAPALDLRTPRLAVSASRGSHDIIQQVAARATKRHRKAIDARCHYA